MLAEGAFPGYVCPTPQFTRDLYRMGDNLDCLSSEMIYDNVVLLVIRKHSSLLRIINFHLDIWAVLWSVGDCIPYDADGRHVPELDCPDRNCGKILLIDTADSTFEVVAKGVPTYVIHNNKLGHKL